MQMPVFVILLFCARLYTMLDRDVWAMGQQELVEG